MFKIKICSVILSFVLLFFLVSCEIQENEIEKVVDMRCIPGAPFTEEKQVWGKYFIPPYDDTASIHMI